MNSEIGADDFVRPHLGRARAEAALRVTAPQTTQRQPSDSHAPQGKSLGRADGPVGERYSGIVESNGETASLGFGDLLDVINPLHHIPVISTLYREFTGDEISAPAKVLGGVLYGGGVGLVSSMVEVVASEAAGQDMDKAILATLFGDDEPDPVAQNAVAPSSANADGDGEKHDGKPDPVAMTSPPVAAAATDGPVLTGQAAIEAFMSDMAQMQTEAGLVPSTAAASDWPAAREEGGVGVPLPLPSALTPGIAAPRPALGAVPSGLPPRQQVEAPRVLPLRPQDWGNGTPQPTPLPTQFGGNGAVYPGLSGKLLQGASVGEFPSALDPGLIAAQRVAAGETGTGQGAADFSHRMLQGVERYEAMARAADNRTSQ